MLTHRSFDREALRLGCWILAGDAPPALPAAGRMAAPGRCRLASAASSATRWCGRPPLCLGLRVLSTGSCSGSSCSQGRSGPSCLQAAGARAREKELTPIEDDDEPFVEEDDRSSVSLGFLFHAFMSAKARLGWLLTTAYRSLVASAPQGKAAAFERQEPNIGGRAAPPISRRRRKRISSTRAGSKTTRTKRTKHLLPARRARRLLPREAQIVRQVRVAVGIGSDCAKGF